MDVTKRSPCTLAPTGSPLAEACQAYPLAGAVHEAVKDRRYLTGSQGCVVAAVNGTGDAVAGGSCFFV
tara:strand:- start:158 stop:361 length:204 start_codon:yes stop_codon:yes gene_type:complete